MNPGAIQLTRMFFGANSMARAFVMPIIAALLVAYATLAALKSQKTIEEVAKLRGKKVEEI